MLINNEKRNRKVSIITDNEYLKLGLLSILSELDPKSFVGNAIFIDVDSLKLMSDFGTLLKNAYANRASVILICAGEICLWYWNDFLTSILTKNSLYGLEISRRCLDQT